jgi:hypothetical protein
MLAANFALTSSDEFCLRSGEATLLSWLLLALSFGKVGSSTVASGNSQETTSHLLVSNYVDR